MNVTETKNQGLTREYAVTVDAKTINEQMEAELKLVGGRVKIAGFRPGKVPLSVLKQRYGKSVMGDVVERAVNQSSQQVLKEKSLRPAMPPKVEITAFEEGGDLAYRLQVETMPEIPEIDFGALAIEKWTAEIDEQEVEEAIARLTERNRAYTKREKDARAEKGDQVVIDFTGRVGSEEFEGGAAKDFKLVLGGGQFIAGFEEQLIGAREGEERLVRVTFPENYHKSDLAGKPA